jgi:hypothetical protein
MENYEYKDGHKHCYVNGYLVRIEYENGNWVQRQYRLVNYLLESYGWYRQDGTRVMPHEDDKLYYNEKGLLQKTVYANGYEEKYYSNGI